MDQLLITAVITWLTDFDWTEACRELSLKWQSVEMCIEKLDVFAKADWSARLDTKWSGSDTTMQTVSVRF